MAALRYLYLPERQNKIFYNFIIIKQKVMFIGPQIFIVFLKPSNYRPFCQVHTCWIKSKQWVNTRAEDGPGPKEQAPSQLYSKYNMGVFQLRTACVKSVKSIGHYFHCC